jgi:hypothetical protein
MKFLVFTRPIEGIEKKLPRHPGIREVADRQVEALGSLFDQNAGSSWKACANIIYARVE